MKVLKILAVIILVLVAAYLVVPLFLADNVIIRADENINAKPEVVFRQVNSLKNWVNWSPFEADTTLKNKFSGPDRGVGCKREWDGVRAGKGTMEIMTSEPYTYIQNKISFAPGQGGGVGSWNFEPSQEGVHVTWSIHLQDLSYPHARWMGLMMQSVLQPMLEKGLTDLKSLAEKMPQPPDVEIVEVQNQPALIIPDSTTLAGMEEMYERNFNRLFEYVSKKKIPVTGQHFAIYHSWNPEGYSRISVGIPVPKDSRGSGNIKYFEVPAGKAVFTRHVGGMNTEKAHYAIDDYIRDFNLKTKDYIWETYFFDPERDADSTTWVTAVYYPITE